MIRRPPRSTRTDTLFPYTTLFRSNKNQCKECHSLAGEIVPIGPKARNFILDPAASDKLRSVYFENPAALKPTMPQWDDPKAGSVAERARAYLDVNCAHRSEEHTSELQSLMRISYAVFCLKKKKQKIKKYK